MNVQVREELPKERRTTRVFQSYGARDWTGRRILVANGPRIGILRRNVRFKGERKIETKKQNPDISSVSGF